MEGQETEQIGCIVFQTNQALLKAKQLDTTKLDISFLPVQSPSLQNCLFFVVTGSRSVTAEELQLSVERQLGDYNSVQQIILPKDHTPPVIQKYWSTLAKSHERTRKTDEIIDKIRQISKSRGTTKPSQEKTSGEAVSPASYRRSVDLSKLASVQVAHITSIF